MKVFFYCLHSTIETKGVAKEMKKICTGPQCDEGVKWFTELSDKGTNFSIACRKQERFFM